MIGMQWMRAVSFREMVLLSCRFVPDQTSDAVFEQIKSAVEFQFARRRSPNELTVRKVQSWEWWEAETTSDAFRAAEDALRSAWHKEPLRMRAGASLAVVGTLESCLGAPVVQIPFSRPTKCAMESAKSCKNITVDANTECVLLSDLLAGVDVLTNLLENLAAKDEKKLQPRATE